MIQKIVSHKFIVLCLSVLAAIPFLIGLPEIKTVDNVDYFTIENDPDLTFYEELKTIFGNDEFFVIAFKKDNLFTKKNLETLKQLTDELSGIEGVRDIKSLSNVDDTIGEEDFFIVRKFLETIPEDTAALEALRKKAVGNPLYLKNLVSNDGNTAAIVISVHENPENPDFRKKIIAQAETILGKYKKDTGAVYMAGWTVTNLALARYMKKDIATFIPVTYGFIALAVFLFFRNIRLTLIAVINISLCMGCTMGLFPILGIALNNITTIVPPVVIALALCDTVHIFSALDGQLFEKYPDKKMAFEAILKKLAGPCFLTTLTTAIGFLSLYLSDIPSIREFSLIASAGMVFEYFFAFTFLPAFMLLFNEKKLIRSGPGKWEISPYLTGLSDFVFRYFKAIFTIGILIIIFSIGLSFKISVETNLLDYFKPTSPVRISTGFVEKELAGVGTLDISFKSQNDQAFKLPENLQVIESLQDYIDGIEGVDKTLSFVDFIKDMNQSFNRETPEFYKVPGSSDLISQYLLIYESDDIRDFVNESFDHARLSIRMSKHSTRDQAMIVQKIRDFIAGMETKGIDTQVSGRAIQDVNAIDALVSGQVNSLITASVIIVLIMFSVLRSFSLGCLSILPNLFPIALNFGIMGLFNIPLNTATALIAAVAIGIAVDDTIHFLTEFKQNFVNGADVRKAIHETIQKKGSAMILSSLILTIGFGVMIFSNFVPTVYFGLLSAIIMLTALIGDTLILPAAILIIHKNKKV
ncbi:MAG: RND transporter [Desulfobacula sp. GWF2_41_7]|nr:MAG: RND transporter [Desulfobacula sp. GWF2_41_7]